MLKIEVIGKYSGYDDVVWSFRVQGYSKLVGNFVGNCAIKERVNRLSNTNTEGGDKDEEKADDRISSRYALSLGRTSFCGKGKPREVFMDSGMFAG
jgi:hypothetical protein